MNNKQQFKGVTLVELLVVIGVMALLMTIMIPQVRMITKDRSIREAARIVGATFNDTSTKARSDGFAGIAIARNQNVVRDDAPGGNFENPVFYAGYEMYQLRKPLVYHGNNIGDQGVIASLPYVDFATGLLVIDCEIPEPLSGANIPAGSFVRLNNSANIRYRVLNDAVNSGTGIDMTVTCILPNHLEPPPVGVDVDLDGTFDLPLVDFEVEFPPQLRQTSRVDLPKGYMINLNYSGPIDFFDSVNPPPTTLVDDKDWTWTAFSQSETWVDTDSDGVVDVDEPGPHQPIYIIFDSDGGIDRIYPNGFTSEPIILDGSLHLCISPDEVKHSFQSGALSDSLNSSLTDVLDDSAVMWISINHVTGSVSINDTALPTITFTAADTAVDIARKKAARLREALIVSSKRQNATQ